LSVEEIADYLGAGTPYQSTIEFKTDEVDQWVRTDGAAELESRDKK
jgi:hypothetical protein